MASLQVLFVLRYHSTNVPSRPTRYFAAAGLDLEIGRNFQTFIGVRGDSAADLWAVTGQIGLIYKLN